VRAGITLDFITCRCKTVDREFFVPQTSSWYPQSPPLEAVSQSPAIDIQGFEDLHDRFYRKCIAAGPVDDVEIFFAGLEAIQNGIEEMLLVLEFALEESEVAAVEFDPEAFALQVFDPPGPEIDGPVLRNPVLDGMFAEVVSYLFTLDPLEPLGFFDAVRVDAFHIRGSISSGRGRAIRRESVTEHGHHLPTYSRSWLEKAEIRVQANRELFTLSGEVAAVHE
jgi:hypothetical protein